MIIAFSTQSDEHPIFFRRLTTMQCNLKLNCTSSHVWIVGGQGAWPPPDVLTPSWTFTCMGVK